MRTLAFDGRMGASGDMLLAALLAAGADEAALDPVEAGLGVRYDIGETVKNGIAAATVDVLLEEPAAEGENAADDGGGSDGTGGEGHDHGHDHAHEHDHGHHHDPGATGAEGSGPSRTYAEVVDIVESLELPESVEADALAIFERLGTAEAAIHGVDLEETHFHEVGADDAIADIVGAALLVDDLGVERIVTTPVSAGGGEIEMSHGRYPVPPPAVVEIAEDAGWALSGGPVEAELLTPTGAAILAHFATGVDSLPALDLERSGYGAGGYDFPEHPNVLRALVGEDRSGLTRDDIAVLETNLDDASPELLGGLQETLADAGALDVSIVPMTMKKSRPGHLVKVVAKPADARRVARRLAEETGTLGVREAGTAHRWIAERRIEPATIDVDGTEYTLDVKVASAGGEVYDVSAEYDDAAEIARETALPIREVMRRAERAFERDR